MASDITLAELHALGLRGAATANTSDADLLVHCESASATARAYVRGRYPNAGTITDPAYKEAVACVAAYRILSTRGFDPLTKGADANVLSRKNEARKFFRDVEDGTAHLDIPETEADTFTAALGTSGLFGPSFGDDPRSG